MAGRRKSTPQAESPLTVARLTAEIPTFADAVAQIRDARLRPEIRIQETPAPQRLAPHSLAMTADVMPPNPGRDPLLEDVDDLATGRLVLLHDPAGHEAWQGVFRLVTYVRAALDHEMATDPVLPAVGWAWLVEALAAHEAGFTAASGTVTRVASETFGAMAGEPGSAEIEIRASWTPTDGRLGAHVEAWADLLSEAAGLPSTPEGVVALPVLRRQQ